MVVLDRYFLWDILYTFIAIEILFCPPCIWTLVGPCVTWPFPSTNIIITLGDTWGQISVYSRHAYNSVGGSAWLKKRIQDRGEGGGGGLELNKKNHCHKKTWKHSGIDSRVVASKCESSGSVSTVGASLSKRIKLTIILFRKIGTHDQHGLQDLNPRSTWSERLEPTINLVRKNWTHDQLGQQDLNPRSTWYLQLVLRL